MAAGLYVVLAFCSERTVAVSDLRLGVFRYPKPMCNGDCTRGTRVLEGRKCREGIEKGLVGKRQEQCSMSPQAARLRVDGKFS